MAYPYLIYREDIYVDIFSCLVFKRGWVIVSMVVM